jgi:hypothetical protein
MRTVEQDLTPGSSRPLYGHQNGGHMHAAITIRYAQTEDGFALARLAALDDHPPLRRDALLGFVDGELKAAVAVDGEAIADPFDHTAELVELLRLRANQRGERWAA